MINELQKNIVFFDGACALCNRAVIKIVKNDPDGIFYFASLQSALGQEAKSSLNLDPNYLEGIIVYTYPEERFSVAEKAAVAIIDKLPVHRVWKFLIHLVPNMLLKTIYKLIAKKRYAIWGEADEVCRLDLMDVCKLRLLN